MPRNKSERKHIAWLREDVKKGGGPIEGTPEGEIARRRKKGGGRFIRCPKMCSERGHDGLDEASHCDRQKGHRGPHLCEGALDA